MLKNSLIIGHLTAIITIIFWGTTFIATKILLLDFTPIEILFIRFLMGFLALYLAYPHRLKLTDSSQLWYFMSAGLFGVTLYFLLENIALTYTLIANVGILVTASPFFTAILSHIFATGEKLHKRFFLGFLIAISGICLIMFNGNVVLNLNPLGDLLALGAALAWSLYSICMQKISTFSYNTVQVTRTTFMYGLIFMLPALFIFDVGSDITRFYKPVNIFNFLFLGLGASALCFATWNYAIKTIGTLKTSVYIYLIPVIAVITAALILDEKLSFLTIIGILLTLLGLIISENRLQLLYKYTKK